MIIRIPLPSACPICGQLPFIGRCEPWPRNEGPAPWAVGCYSNFPKEHFVGVNGDNQLDAIQLWNMEADKISPAP